MTDGPLCDPLKQAILTKENYVKETIRQNEAVQLTNTYREITQKEKDPTIGVKVLETGPTQVTFVFSFRSYAE